jgi:single-strand DNA-binding protein
MAGSLNKVQLIGNVGKDPEVRTMNSGDKMVSFSVATSESWKDKTSGERKEKTEWHNVVIFNDGLIKVVEQYVKKGSKIYVEGAMQTRKWQDQSGNDRYTTEVVLQKFNGTLVLLGDKGTGHGQSGDPGPGSDTRAPTSSANTNSRPRATTPAQPDPIDDDIPF